MDTAECLSWQNSFNHYILFIWPVAGWPVAGWPVAGWPVAFL